MLGWFARLLLIVAGSITSWFIARDALNFDIIRMVIAVLLFTLVVMIAAFWPTLTNWFKSKKKK